MRTHTFWRIAAALSALLAGAAVAMPSATAAVPPAFSPVTTYSPQIDVPGPVSCVGPRFCMELAYGADVEGLGSPPGVLVTTNGGASWRYQLAPTLGRVHPLLSTLTCSSSATCVVDNQGQVLRTLDGGATWSAVSGTGPHASTSLLACASSGKCLSVTLRRNVLVFGVLGRRASRFDRAHATGVPHGVTPDALACNTAHRCVLAGTRTVRGVSELVTLVTAGPASVLHWRLAGHTPDRRVVQLACASATSCAAVEVMTPRGHRPVVEFVRSGVTAVSWRPVARLPIGRGEIETPTSPATIGDELACSTARTCAVVVDGPTTRILVTRDGGRRWRSHTFVAYRASTTPMTANGACLTSGRCVVDGVSTSGVSGPGGGFDEQTRARAWQTVPIPSSPALATSLVCAAGDTCYRIDRLVDVHGYGAALEVSADGGITWRGVRVPRGIEPFVIGGCQTATACEVIGVRGIRLVRGELGNYDFRRAAMIELSTTDGGATWQAHHVAARFAYPMGASCTSATACVVLAGRVNTFPWSQDNALVSSTNGETWHVQPLGGRAPQSGPDWLLVRSFLEPWALSCDAGGTCLFAPGTREAPLSSSNFGASWTHAAVPVRGAVVGGLACTTTKSCLASYVHAGDVGLARTSNAGRSWTTASLPLPDPSLGGGVYAGGVPQLACTSATACTAVMPEYFARPGAVTTTDGGTTWTVLAWHGTVPVAPAHGVTAVGLLTCSTTACLVEAKGSGGSNLAYQLERVALP